LANQDGTMLALITILAATAIVWVIGLAGFLLPTSKPPEHILPTRMVAGPGMFPPKDFKAYGIVAFKNRRTESDNSRYTMICNAYVSALLYYKDVPAGLGKQMVTVWPVNDDDGARRINQDVKRDDVCKFAVPQYGLRIAQDAINDAREIGLDLNDRGPFLLAWTPGEKKGQRDAIVLFFDLSDVINEEQAKQVFARWAERIEADASLWSRHNWEDYRMTIMLWADKWGTKLIKARATTKG
jgi:hypothetical protein